MYRMGDHFKVRRNKNDTFQYYGLNNNWPEMRTGLPGNHQVDNMSLALAACEILMKKKTRITLQTICKGIEKHRWPGRLEVVSQKPYIILDGAHNLAAARNLAKFLSDNFSNKNLTLVLGMLDDKPFETILNILLPVCKKVILTRPKIDRALPPETLYPIAKTIKKNVTMCPDVGAAIKTAVKKASKQDVICIAGSLYVVGEAKEFLETGKITYSNLF